MTDKNTMDGEIIAYVAYQELILVSYLTTYLYIMQSNI